MIVIDLEFIAARVNARLPAHAMHDGIGAIVLETAPDQLIRETREQHPHFRIFAMKFPEGVLDLRWINAAGK